MVNDIGNINPAAKPVRSAEKTTAVQRPQTIQAPVKAEVTIDVGQQEKQVKEAISKLNELA